MPGYRDGTQCEFRLGTLNRLTRHPQGVGVSLQTARYSTSLSFRFDPREKQEGEKRPETSHPYGPKSSAARARGVFHRNESASSTYLCCLCRRDIADRERLLPR